MMSKHTEGKWEYTNYGFIIDSNQEGICQFFNKMDDNFKNMNENAARIVACVNACEGVSNEDLQYLSVKKSAEYMADNIILRDANYKLKSYSTILINSLESINNHWNDEIQRESFEDSLHDIIRKTRDLMAKIDNHE
jgi:hypothetical protein